MANPNGNIQTLKVPTSEEARINGKKGGLASGEARRNKKTFTNAVKWLVNTDLKIDSGNIVDMFKKNGVNIEGLDTTQLATLGLWAGAVYGNANNFKTLMEVNGEIIEEEPSYIPNIEEVEEIVDNSNLEKVLYEEDKS